MDDSEHALPQGLVGRPFTLAEGRAAGLSPWALDGSGLRAPTRGVRTAENAPAAGDVAARCRELLPVLPPEAVFSHVTGLHLLGIDRPRGLRRPDDIHLEVPSTRYRPRRRGVTSHHSTTSAQLPAVLRGGLPVVPAPRLWVQLAGELDDAEVVVLGDAMLRRGSAQTGLGDLEREVAHLAPRTRGLHRLRLALPRLRAGTDSCQETRLRLALVGSGLPCPQVNRPVLDGAGRFVALPDLSYPERSVAIEYDGDVHRTEPRAWRRDVARRQLLEHAGWRQITCTADDVRDPTRAVAWIRSALDRPGGRVHTSPGASW
jgi:hypothetical protein